MQKYYKLLVSNLKDVKKRRTAAFIFIILITILVFTVISFNGNPPALTANLTCLNQGVREAAVTVRPAPVFKVKITADDRITEVMSSGSVSDALENADIHMDDNDLINIGLTEKLNNNTNIVINRVQVMEEIHIEEIDYATEYKEDETLTAGYRKTIVDGEEGEIEKVIKHTYIDGELIESDVVSEEITEPVDEVVLLGTKEKSYIEEFSISQLEVPDWLQLDENGVPLSYSDVFTGKSCAYSAKAGAKTASGRTAMVGYVAVDPKIIPYGTELYIATTDNSAVYGYAIAADTGRALLDGRIIVDLFMESYDASCDWGARQVNIYVLD